MSIILTSSIVINQRAIFDLKITWDLYTAIIGVIILILVFKLVCRCMSLLNLKGLKVQRYDLLTLL